MKADDNVSGESALNMNAAKNSIAPAITGRFDSETSFMNSGANAYKREN